MLPANGGGMEMHMKNKQISAVLLTAAMALSSPGTVMTYAGNLDPNSDAKAVSEQVAAEGAVLLRNEQAVLPLAPNQKVAVFGRSQIDTSYGGGGSGTVHSSETWNFIRGFDEAGVNYDKDLSEIYKSWCEAQNTDEESSTFGTMGEAASKEEMPVEGLDVASFAQKNDAAIVIFARNSSEGSDREAVAGDWYLSESEEALLKTVSENFEKVIVVLNTGSVMDTSWIDTYGVDAVLEAWQPGGYGTASIGRILTGEINPSGHLTDTWAVDYSAYPTQKVASASFGKYVINPIYGEDIYVGYRYFETFAPEDVRYAFGYGLSYTSFDYTVSEAKADDENVTVKVTVTNTGDIAGKDVVQSYYSAPIGQLGNPRYELGAFTKTEELAPGESETVTLTFATSDMASYDDSGVTENENSYVLEPGDYKIYVGSSVEDLTEAATYTVDELKVVETYDELLAPTFAFNVLKAAADEEGNYQPTYEKASLRHEDNKYEEHYDADLPSYELTGEDKGIRLGHVANGDASMQEFISQFTLPELTQIYGGIYGVREDNYHYFPENAAGAAGGIGQTLQDRGVDFTVMADGPAGIRLTMKEGDNGNTYFPVGTMQASTWNQALIERMGQEIGKEMKINQVSVWLAPAMNIHRDPLCGRNFEYYSEDPLVSGLIGTSVVNGVQSEGMSVSAKHFALNSQEYNRNGGDSIATERAIREIYLKGFEIMVKNSNPGTIMSSYNKINGHYASTDYELLTAILRNEWGFTGAVTTDWAAGKDGGNAGMIRAQGDLCMPSLVGRADPELPEGFSTEGATTNWYGTVHSGEVYCTYCGTKYGDYSLFKINNLYLPVDRPCFNADGIVKDCDRPYEKAVVNVLPEGYTHDDDHVYDADGNIVTDYSAWLNDRTGLVTGYVNGEVTLGELERSAENIFNLILKLGTYQTETAAPAK